MGSDPGMGVLHAAAAAGVALGARYAYDKYQEYQAGKTLPTAVSLTIDVVGKIWNIPNTVLGLAYGGVGHVAGWFMGTDPQIQFGHNGIEFLNNPVIAKDGALTLGNAISFHTAKRNRHGNLELMGMTLCLMAFMKKRIRISRKSWGRPSSRPIS